MSHGSDGTLEAFDVVVSTDTTRSGAQLRGELDLATAPRLERLLDRLRRDGHREITLDLAQLKFLDAAGLGVFVRADTALRAAGGRLVLTHPTPMARRILTITGLDRTLTVR